MNEMGGCSIAAYQPYGLGSDPIDVPGSEKVVLLILAIAFAFINIWFAV